MKYVSLCASTDCLQVCYEYVPAIDGVVNENGEESVYELITHVPTNSGNYLTAALRSLEKNT